ncbi:MAG: phosphonate ABC transporter, permease protein PhnE [Thaumarchaeota archaeon]|nr:phosphonate ABC transporter, permease protein PhnE [Nitrososphaerota archaeon]
MKPNSQAIITPLVISIAIIASMWNVGFFDFTRMTRGTSNLGVFVGGLFPPNFGVFDKVSWAILETIQMSFAGTMLGFVIALPLGVLGAKNIFGPITVGPVRLLLAVVRTIPALLWALIFVVTLGLGPLPGTLGLAAYTVGYLGKLYYEALEAVDPEVIEAVGAIGTSKLQLVRHAIIPESANQILSQLLFMFEYNVRASSILGFVGAGGVGFYMLGYIQTLQYRELMAVIIMTLFVVLTIDYVSSKVRSRFLFGQK